MLRLAPLALLLLVLPGCLTAGQRAAAVERRVEADFERLTETALLGMQALLEDPGTFQSFGLTLDRAGELRVLEAPPMASAEAQRAQTEAALRGVLAEGDVRAAALCADAWYTAPGAGRRPALVIQLRHALGASREYVLPYRRAGGAVAYDAPVFLDGPQAGGAAPAPADA